MKTRLFPGTFKSLLSLSFIAFMISFVGCKKDLDNVKLANDNQKKDAQISSLHYALTSGDVISSDSENPTIAVNNNNKLVAIYKRSSSAGSLYYMTGDITNDNNGYKWNSPVQLDDYGAYPSVAINDNNVVVEVHKSASANYSNDTYYHVGQLNGSNIQWGNSATFSTGENPKIAFNKNNIIVVVYHNRANSALYYKVGIVNPNTKTIAWGAERSNGGRGNNQSISMNNLNMVVDVYEGENNQGLFYRFGILSPATKTIIWDNPQHYQSGSHPDVALSDNNFVSEVHYGSKESGSAIYKLYTMGGSVSNGKIVWSQNPTSYASGVTPCIAANNNNVIQANTTVAWWLATRFSVAHINK
ncbi:MAG: hypothetical protein ACEPOV_12250 [Hyphomicrobiales bacterium]